MWSRWTRGRTGLLGGRWEDERGRGVTRKDWRALVLVGTCARGGRGGGGGEARLLGIDLHALVFSAALLACNAGTPCERAGHGRARAGCRAASPTAGLPPLSTAAAARRSWTGQRRAASRAPWTMSPCTTASVLERKGTSTLGPLQCPHAAVRAHGVNCAPASCCESACSWSACSYSLNGSMSVLKADS